MNQLSVINTGIMPLKVGSTIGGGNDTTPPTPLTSNVYDQLADVSASGYGLAASGASGTRTGSVILSGAAAIGKNIIKIKMNLQKQGTPTGSYQITVRNSSDTVVATSGNQDVTALTTSYVELEFTMDLNRELAEGDRILAEYAGGSGGNEMKVNSKNDTIPAGFKHTIYNYDPVYVDITTWRNVDSFDSDPTI